MSESEDLNLVSYFCERILKIKNQKTAISRPQINQININQLNIIKQNKNKKKNKKTGRRRLW